MERKIVWTERASGDIEAIVRYIARRDPNAAGRIGAGIYDRVQILHQNPEAGSILDELSAGVWPHPNSLCQLIQTKSKVAKRRREPQSSGPSAQATTSSARHFSYRTIWRN